MVVEGVSVAGEGIGEVAEEGERGAEEEEDEEDEAAEEGCWEEVAWHLDRGVGDGVVVWC